MMVESIKASQYQDLSISTDITDLTLRVQEGVNSTLSGFMGFRGYKSSDFPEVECDTRYFFLYGTDHKSPPSEGKIKWGKGNFLDLRDFQEVGIIVEGYQAETPWLIRVPSEECGDNEVLHFFFHTLNEPGSQVAQETRLFTSSGGVLSDDIWNDRGWPLDIVGNENHTGYCHVYKRGVSDYLAIHLTLSGTPPEWKVSTSTDCRNWNRSYTYDLSQGLFPGYWVKPGHGQFFDKYGQKWFLGTIEPEGGSPDIYSVDKNLMLAKADDDFQITEMLKILNNSEYGRLFEATTEGNNANIYLQNPVNAVYHANYNLENLLAYL